ncbi:ExbD/TolR family protein [Pleionea sediminis]|uniref:ExbD/TolR family protein n=1 Tax=Pleionea sediminis TaxID=2569479 RepID=UPI001185A838|nr:biopolymer transporter ExbD [Pleionea sediminis]
METTNLNESNLSFSNVKQPVFATKLNLVALMDIFTILVFFLLLNSGDAERLENAKFVTLPNSSSADAPHVEAVIMIGKDNIWLNDEKVVAIDDVLKSKEESISALTEALTLYKEKRGELTAYEKENGLSATVMGDRDVSYSLLKEVLSTCQDNDFRDISLAVNRVATQSFKTTHLTGVSSDKVAQLSNSKNSGG